MKRYLHALGLAALIACQSPPTADSEPASESANSGIDEGSADPTVEPAGTEADEGSADPTVEPAGTEAGEGSGEALMLGAPYMPPAPPGTAENRPETARVWVGLYCDTDPASREFSFWVNGREQARVETLCSPFDDGSAPDAQFSFLVPTEVLVLRVQDDTADAHSELQLGVTSNRFVTVTHRQVGADSGFLTSFEETSTRPSFAIVE